MDKIDESGNNICCFCNKPLISREGTVDNLGRYCHYSCDRHEIKWNYNMDEAPKGYMKSLAANHVFYPNHIFLINHNGTAIFNAQWNPHKDSRTDENISNFEKYGEWRDICSKKLPDDFTPAAWMWSDFNTGRVK